MKVLILGVNGFIGHSLTARILKDTDWEVFGMDLGSDRVSEYLDHKRFRFLEGDISINREWIEYHIKKCDAILPLVAIATPKTYVDAPLRVFELDFEENLRVVRQTVKYNRRMIFPSTSEVYGMSPDTPFNEETSNLVLGPICKQRWIYSCAKQLLDRVIWAYGRDAHLRFTLFRPFNWIGPNLDDIDAPKEGSSRVVTQFLGHLLRNEPIRLVDGGRQRRSFTYIEDGVEALMRILENKDGCADGQIFNLGNPRNDCSMRELAEQMIRVMEEFKEFKGIGKRAVMQDVSAVDYYGKDYQDIQTRVPDITRARTKLGWEPRVNLRDALRRTVAYYVAEESERQAWRAMKGTSSAVAPPSPSRSGRPRWTTARAFWVAAVAAVLISFAGVFDHALWTPDEPRDAEVGREMLVSGNYVVPTLAEKPFLEKPPLAWWAMSGLYKLFGVSDGVARMSSALAGLLTLLLVFDLVRRIADPFAALMATLVTGCLSGFYYEYHRVIVDPWLSLFVMLGYWGYVLAMSPPHEERFTSAIRSLQSAILRPVPGRSSSSISPAASRSWSKARSVRG